MAGITLSQAEEQLSEALTALSVARKALQTRHGANNMVTRQQVNDLREDVTYWNNMVKSLGGGGLRVYGGTPT